MKILKSIFSLTFPIILTSLVSCSPSHNTVSIENDEHTGQTAYFSCEPRNQKCPHEIVINSKGIFKDIKTITAVYKEKIYVIYFSSSGTFRLKISNIVSSDTKPIGLRGQCEKIEIYSSYKKIQCQ